MTLKFVSIKGMMSNKEDTEVEKEKNSEPENNKEEEIEKNMKRS